MVKNKLQKKLDEMHETLHLSLEEFEENYVDNLKNGNIDYERTKNIIHNVDAQLFKLKNDADVENENLQRQIKNLNKEINRMKKHNIKLSVESAGLKNSHLGAEQLLKDKESIYLSTVLETVNFFAIVVSLCIIIYKNN